MAWLFTMSSPRFINLDHKALIVNVHIRVYVHTHVCALQLILRSWIVQFVCMWKACFSHILRNRQQCCCCSVTVRCWCIRGTGKLHAIDDWQKQQLRATIEKVAPGVHMSQQAIMGQLKPLCVICQSSINSFSYTMHVHKHVYHTAILYSCRQS